MTSLHYPSLELCKKLTEVGFHNTNLAWFTNTHCNKKSWIMDCGEMDKFKRYVCPSVMELLDEMPNWITIKYKDGDVGNYKLEIGRQGTSESIEAYYVHYVEGNGAYAFYLNTLPNALSEMWLYLKQNNYI